MINYTIKLIDNQKLPYKTIFSFESINIEILKIYIKINLVNNFMNFPKSIKLALIFFIIKPDINLWLCIDY